MSEEATPTGDQVSNPATTVVGGTTNVIQSGVDKGVSWYSDFAEGLAKQADSISQSLSSLSGTLYSISGIASVLAPNSDVGTRVYSYASAIDKGAKSSKAAAAAARTSSKGVQSAAKKPDAVRTKRSKQKKKGAQQQAKPRTGVWVY